MEESFCGITTTTNMNTKCIDSDDKVKNMIEYPVLEKHMELLKMDDEKGDVYQFKSDVLPGISSSRPCTSNRRYSLRPKKLPETTSCNEWLAVATAKKIPKAAHRNRFLETIFENPICSNTGLVTLVGKTKLKRSITFSEFVTKAKTKHRKIKIKRLRKGKIQKSCKVTLEDVRRKLKSLEDSSDEEDWMDIVQTEPKEV